MQNGIIDSLTLHCYPGQVSGFLYYLPSFPRNIMAEEDPEHAILAKEMLDLKAKIQGALGSFKDKTAPEVCAGLAAAPKVKLQTKKILRGHIHKVNAIHFAEDNRHLVSGSLDGKLIIWDTWTGVKEAIIPLKSSWVLAVAYAPSGQFVASGGMDNAVTVYNLHNFDAEGNPKIYWELGFEGFLNCCRFQTDKTLLTGSGDLKLTCWDLVKGLSQTELFGHSGDVASVAISPNDSNIMVTGSLDQTSKLWDLRVQGACQTFWGHTGDVNCVAFHPSGMAFTTASEDNTAKLYDIRSDQEVAQYVPLEAEDEGLSSCVISKSGRYILAGHAEGGIHIWDILKTDLAGTLMGHESRVTSLTISPNGIAIGSASWDQNVRIWF